jgi:tetratricopeptide (TPR) repeat protein
LSGPQVPPGQRPLIERYPPAGEKGRPPSQRPPAEENNRPNLPYDPSATSEVMTPKTGQDIYFDLLTSLQPQRPGVVAARGDPFAALLRRPETPAQQPDQAQRPDQEHPLPPDRAPDRSSDKLERRQNVLVLHSLAGEGPDLFNRHMRQAEAWLAQRKFYEAAQEYELAALMDRSNPLARLGNALALVGAGEPRAAALDLQSALRYFPPLMDTRVDVPKILGKELAGDRLALIQQRIESDGQKVDPSLVMLAAFVSSSLDQPDKARQYAAQLKSIAGDDRLAAAYADRILQPASQPASAPASQPARP